MSGKHVGFGYVVRFSNPYREPPEGRPRVLGEWFETIEQRDQRRARGEDLPEWLRELAPLGSGYSIYIAAINKPTKPMSQGTLASVRRQRAQRRIEAKYPLFAEQFVEDELESKPEYYEGVTRADLQAMIDEALQAEREVYERFLEVTGGNHVKADSAR